MAQFPALVKEASSNNWTSQGRDEQHRLVGTIVHELFHNFGYKHPKYVDHNVNGTGMTSVAGNFVYEAGWCVARRGTTDKQPGMFGLVGFSTPEEHRAEFFVD